MSSSAAESEPGNRGKLIVISGPSGAGKTSICDALLARVPGTQWSVSITTRPMRPGDVSGRTYEFVDEEEFVRRQAADELLESARYVGYRYGTPRDAVEKALAAGKNVILEIDVQGGVQIAEKVPDSIRVFVLPPDHESLKARLEGRKTEAAAQMERRLAAADGEIAFARDSGCYDYFVVNDDLEETIQQVRDIIEREKARS